MAAPSPIKEVLYDIGLAMCYEAARILDGNGRSPLRSNSRLKKHLLSGEAVKVEQGRAPNGQFTANGALRLYMLDYIQWLDSGRKKFAKRVPISAILLFIKHRTIGQGRVKGKYAKRTVSLNQLAFMIQNAIWKNGIRARPVLNAVWQHGQELLDLYLNNRGLDDMTFALDKDLGFITS